jgi:DNA-binding MarR family transcriptional regulator
VTTTGQEPLQPSTLRVLEGPDGGLQLPLTDDERETWTAFVRVQTSLIRRLDDELQVGFGLSLNMLEVMYQLSTVPGNRLRMTELAERLLFTRSGVTRLVARLERQGLVLRSGVDHDQRGRYATLTHPGFEVLQQAATDHCVLLRELFFEPLSHGSLLELREILARLEAEPIETGSC